MKAGDIQIIKVSDEKNDFKKEPKLLKEGEKQERQRGNSSLELQEAFDTSFEDFN